MTVTVGRYDDRSWSGQNGKPGTTTYVTRPRTRGKGNSLKRRKSSVREYLEPKPYSLTVTEEQRGLFYVKLKPEEMISRGLSLPYCEVVAVGHQSATPPVDAAAKTKLLAKIRQTAYGSGFSPLVFAAEGREAMSMISNAATSIGAAVHGLRTGNVKMVAKALNLPQAKVKPIAGLRKNISGRWLELSYGWLPLVGDAEEGAKWLAQASQGSFPKKICRRVHYRLTIPTDWQRVSGLAASVDQVVDYYLQAIVLVKGLTPVYQPNLYSVAEVLWEKLPYSFVADWFVPIGDYIQSLKTDSDIKGTLVYSEKIVAVSDNIRPNPRFCDPSVGIPSLLANKTRTVQFNRTVESGLGSLITAPFSFNEGGAFTSWQRTANAVALLTQRNWSGLAKIWSRQK